jgi:hypothetical protein
VSGNEPHNAGRLDIEYALLDYDKQDDLARAVGLMVWRALKREVWQ